MRPRPVKPPYNQYQQYSPSHYIPLSIAQYGPIVIPYVPDSFQLEGAKADKCFIVVYDINYDSNQADIDFEAWLELHSGLPLKNAGDTKIVEDSAQALYYWVLDSPEARKAVQAKAAIYPIKIYG
jgi:hypothetical protein